MLEDMEKGKPQILLVRIYNDAGTLRNGLLVP